jgi:hypothetical protein
VSAAGPRHLPRNGAHPAQVFLGVRNLDARPLSHGRSGEQEQIQQSHAGIVAENIGPAEDVSEELNGWTELCRIP